MDLSMALIFDYKTDLFYGVYIAGGCITSCNYIISFGVLFVNWNLRNKFK